MRVVKAFSSKLVQRKEKLFFDNFETRKGKKKAFRRYINALKEVLREFDPSS